MKMERNGFTLYSKLVRAIEQGNYYKLKYVYNTYK